MDKYLITLDKCVKIGPITFKKLFSYFKSAEDIWYARPSDLLKAGIDQKLVYAITEHIEKTDCDKEEELLEKQGIKYVSFFDKDYPEKLKEIFSPPFVLYYKGELKKEEECIAIVGTRKPTDYGIQATKDIAAGLAQAGVTVVSGMALGIDTFAHESTLKSHGRTIAILGCGLEKPYPTSNSNLANQIVENGGALVSEYSIGTAPLKQNFPARNRIIAGFSLGVLVVEAGEKSGALITAKDALEQNRDVFALPGNIYNKNSFGPNNLIKMGAKPVANALDILEELNLKNLPQKKEARKVYPKSEEERKIIEFLESEPKHIDDIIKTTGIESQAVSSALTMMEIKGYVKNLGGMVYTVNR
ncbi:MAG: DNA-processing protein DprA [Patescibacteria group bacterium]|nr:DNA-processing protein DprA [Patescibacteria group bacterium]